MNHILIIYLGSRGGGVLDTYHICRSICKSKVNIYSAIISHNNPLKEKYLNLPLKQLFFVNTHKLNFRSFVFHSIMFVRVMKIFRIVKYVNPTAVFITMEHPWMLLVLYYIKKFMPKVKIFYIKHNPSVFTSLASKIYNLALEKIDQTLIKNSDYIYTLSYSVKHEILTTYNLPSYKVYNFNLGAHSILCDKVVHKGFYRDSILRLLFFGRILEYKGIDILVDSYEILKKRSSNFNLELTIAGEGFIDNKLLQRIKTLGIRLMNYWINDDDLCRLLSETDIIVIPYREASQSGPASIAVALGIPVIATKVGGLIEQIHDGINGILIEPNNPEEIVRAIKTILDDPNLLYRFSKGAKSLREGHLSWDNIASKMDEIFYKTL